ncbi:39S ribosomal protein L47, mitochondrial [Athalia rosae]|uniref:39S ribosomal protein L47, mitochondrial n=1 Tax=Athalia rosae TaxID=37344 RepID=UPI0020331F1E|nr:39S ribosomal protein L47, mitochondrial [Athalia rosae]
MAALAKVVHISKAVNNVSKLFTNFTLSSNVISTTASVTRLTTRIPTCANQTACFHTTLRRNDIMEFFDDPKNWGETKVKVGRAWKKDELRLKSNEDLHKLWFVLLKERNMLLTMEHAAKEEHEIFPNPERKDKVDESMENLEEVVRERNRAYHLLETGQDGERSGKVVTSQLGLRYYYRFSEHKIPKFMNSGWRERYKFGSRGHAVRKFLTLYREKLWQTKRKAMVRERNHVMHLIKRFPNMDPEAIKKHYPNVNLEKLAQKSKSRGHYAPR